MRAQRPLWSYCCVSFITQLIWLSTPRPMENLVYAWSYLPFFRLRLRLPCFLSLKGACPLPFLALFRINASSGCLCVPSSITASACVRVCVCMLTEAIACFMVALSGKERSPKTKMNGKRVLRRLCRGRAMEGQTAASVGPPPHAGYKMCLSV